MEVSRESREDVPAGDMAPSVRLSKRPRVRAGRPLPVGLDEIEVDAIELVPFALVTAEDVRLSGERDREALRERAGQAGPIGQDTLVYRIAFHAACPRA